jgi:hypothetical protein
MAEVETVASARALGRLLALLLVESLGPDVRRRRFAHHPREASHLEWSRSQNRQLLLAQRGTRARTCGSAGNRRRSIAATSVPPPLSFVHTGSAAAVGEAACTLLHSSRRSSLDLRIEWEQDVRTRFRWRRFVRRGRVLAAGPPHTSALPTTSTALGRCSPERRVAAATKRPRTVGRDASGVTPEARSATRPRGWARPAAAVLAQPPAHRGARAPLQGG